MNTKLFEGIAAAIHRTRLLRATAFGVLLVAFVAAGCDSSGGALVNDGTGTDNSSFAILTADLGLTQQDAASIASGMDGFDAASVDSPDPGFLWELAAQIHGSLSEAQLDRLMERIEAAPAGGLVRGPGGGPAQGSGAMRDPRQGDGPGGFAAQRPGAARGLRALDLTDEQKEEIRAIHEARRADVRALLEQRGSMDPDAFRAQMDALREEIRAEVQSVLTDDQLEQLESFRQEAEERRAERQAERETRREESRAAMIDVLGLTDDQVSALDALIAEREDRRDAVRQLVDGGAERDEVKAFLDAERTAHQEAVMQIVSERQHEIMQIHAFLAGRFAARRAAGVRQGGPGGPNGPGGQGVRPGGGPGGGPGVRPGGGPGKIG